MHTIRALTLNVWGLPAAPHRGARIALVAEALASAAYDVVAVQEAWLPADRHTLMLGAADGSLPHAAAYPARAPGTGLLILSRWPIREARFTPYLLNGDPLTWDYYAPKGLAFARLAAPFGPLDVYTTHTIAQHSNIPGIDYYHPHRVAQMVQTAWLLNERSAGVPALALGDFNVMPGTLGHRALLTLSGAGEAFADLHPADPGFTYSADNPYKLRTYTRRLDYVFYRSGPLLDLTPTAAEITFRHTPPGSPAPAYSDHYGVAAEFATAPADRLSAPLPALVDPVVQSILREVRTVLSAGDAASRSRQLRRAVLAAASLAGAIALSGRGHPRRAASLPALLALAGTSALLASRAERRAYRTLLAKTEELIHE